MLRNATPLRKSAPWPSLTSQHLWWTCLLYCACHVKCIFDHLCKSSCQRFCPCYKTLHVLLISSKMRNPLHQPRETTSESPKVLRTYLSVFCTFELRATTVRTYSTSQLPKVLRTWGVLYMLTSTCASRHNGVQFFISHLARWLRTHRFSEPTCRPSGATNHWKNTVFRDFPFRAPGSSFFWDFLFFDLLSSSLLFSSLTLPTSAFDLSILSEVWLLNFLRFRI